MELDVFGFFLEDSLSECVCVRGAVWLAACLLLQHTFVKFAYSVTQRQLTWVFLSMRLDVSTVIVPPQIFQKLWNLSRFSPKTMLSYETGLS